MDLELMHSQIYAVSASVAVRLRSDGAESKYILIFFKKSLKY